LSWTWLIIGIAFLSVVPGHSGVRRRSESGIQMRIRAGLWIPGRRFAPSRNDREVDLARPGTLHYRAAPIKHSEADMARLNGRTAIVTGGAKGIGRHYSQALAAEGAQVMIADIADGAALAADIAAKHGRNSTDSMTFDVSDEAQCKALVARTMQRFGKIDILVNNAALYAPLPTLKVTDIDVDLWDKVMAINIRGPFLMVKHVAPHMIAKKYGKIVNIGSGTVARGIPDFSHYVTSKGAVHAFTRCMSRELGEHGIRVNTLAPGYTLSDTGLTNTVHVEASRAAAVARRALKRDQYPEDLLGSLIFLCSQDSDFMTGQVLAVDGGSNNTA
jgi:NAD(P)-dependent dehydrogenase (short-subunit alcohol dehydrogenase family)